ncbi:MAG TPA: hypothetical protein VFC78_13770 [Tepidisphaeraceae bacterium]|nr:hypothetical protein [Tepidisphaeraceae bacterium]
MIRHTAPLIAVICVLTGCGHPPTIMRVSVRAPGFSAQVMDALVASPGSARLFANTGVSSVTAISSMGETDFYLTRSRQAGAQEMRRNIDAALAGFAPQLPAGASAPVITVLPAGQGVPAVQVRQVDQLQVQIDQKKLSAAGISASQLEEFMSHAHRPGVATDKGARDLENKIIKAGKPPVRLGDVARVALIKGPDHLLRHYPPTEQ